MDGTNSRRASRRWHHLLALASAVPILLASPALEASASSSGTAARAGSDTSAGSGVKVPYRDLEIATPASWWLWFAATPACMSPTPRGQVVIGRRPLPTRCATEPATTVRLYSLATIPPPFASHHTTKVNGVPVILGPHGRTHVTYFVPSVLEAVSARGPRSWPIASTLSWSPRHHLTGLRTLPRPPSTWRPVQFAGLRADVPLTWQTTRTKYANAPLCSSDAPSLPAGSVLLDSDRQRSYPPCPYAPPTVGAFLAHAGDALRIDARPGRAASLRAHLSNSCLTIHTLRACPYEQPTVASMVFLVTGPGLHPRLVWIGLNGPSRGVRTAATVLGSLTRAG
jgi:hypothetical protein